MTDHAARQGEVTIDLPPAYDAGLYFIGAIRTPWTDRKACPKNSSEADAVCTLDLAPHYAAGLKDVETASHLIVLYFMHQARRNVLVQAPRHYAEPHGTFSLRSPARPNPIALSVVRLLKVDGHRLEVVGIDCLDGTPLIDIKPYFTSTDCVTDAEVGWHIAEKRRETGGV